MKITHLIKTNGIAGAEGHLLVLLPGLIARGYDIRVVFIAPANGEGEDFAAALEKSGVPVERVPIHKHGSPALMWWLRSILRRHRPDAAHVHLFHAELWGIPAAKLAGIPRIFDSRHNDDPRRSRQPLRLIYRLLWRMTDLAVCISGAVRTLVISEGAPAEKLRVIHYGLPPRAPQDKLQARAALRHQIAAAPDALVFGTVCRLLDWKGVDDAIIAFAKVCTTLPDAHFVITGEGPYRAALEALVQASGVASRVHFIGWQSNAPAVMSGLDVMLVPSHREGFGLVTLEAMNESTPVIAAQAGALPEIVIAGKTGLIVPAKTPDALAEAMQALAGDTDLRHAMGAAGLRRLRESFTAGKMIDETAQLYGALPHTP